MINTYGYGGQKNLREDNTTRKPEVPPSKTLEIKGPFIQVTITHPIEIQEELKRKGLEVYSLQANALIDTGASFTAVSSQIADELNLVQTGFQKISSVLDEQVQPVYYGFIIFPCGNASIILIIFGQMNICTLNLAPYTYSWKHAIQ